MKSAFVITAYSTWDNDCIEQCVESIRMWHSSSEIIVIDSNSPSKKYFKNIEKHRINIHDIGNIHRETGAIWYAYENYPEIDFFFFLQDSLICNENVLHLSEKPFSCLRYFPSWDGKKFNGLPGMLETRCGWADADVPIESDGLGFEYKSLNGLDDRNWLDMQFKKYTNLAIPSEWFSIFGPIFFTHRSLLDKIKNTGFNNILPTNKMESCVMERAWGIAFETFGVDIYNNAIQKYYLHPEYKEEYLFSKNFYLR